MAEHELRLDLPEAFQQAKKIEKFLTLSLLFVLLTAAAAGVNSVLVGPDWTMLWSALLFGLLLGWLLALIRQSAWRTSWISAGLGSIFALLVVGGLIRKLSAMIAAIALHFGQLFFLHTLPAAEWQALSTRTLDLMQASGVIFERIRSWGQALASGQPVFDPVAAALVWSLLAWLVAAWAGWLVEARKNTFIATLPAILLSVGSLSYARRTSPVIYIILGAALLLLATVQHDRREHLWDQTGTSYPKRKGRQIGWVAVLLSVGLVALAAILPTLSIAKITGWFETHNRPVQPQESGLAKSLGIVPAATTTPDSFEKLRQPGLPRALLIGSGPELSEQVVMSVEVNDLAQLPQGSQPVPFYWRSFTYDLYTGHGWQTSGIQENPFEADQSLPAENSAGRLPVEQTVRPVANQAGTLYAAGEPVWVDQAGIAAWRSSNDLFGIRLASSGSYQTRSLLPLPGEQSLRSAGENYPDWVKRRYLALPAEVPGRVKSLAIELTASGPTPYDRAKAIEQYVRKFPYTLEVPLPPSNRDLVDYFLFDLQRGYCDYYATAMVVLARAAGIPARLAVGYASGTFNLNSHRFVVTQADAHSWVEIYFPAFGWLPFEPTAARPSFDRAQTAETTPQAQIPTPPPGGQASTSQPMSSGRQGGLFLLGIAGLAATLLAAWLVWKELRLRHLPESEAVVEIYRRMQIYAKKLAVACEPGDTPYEFAARFNAHLEQLGPTPNWPATNFPLTEEIQALANRIVRTSYQPVYPSSSQAPRLYPLWKALRWHLTLLRFSRAAQAIIARTLIPEAGETRPENDNIQGRDGS